MKFDTGKFDELARQLLDSIPPGLRHLHDDLEKNFRAILQSAFVKMDLVTREEFDAQVGVLRRTREKLDALEQQLKNMQENQKDS